MYKEGDFIAGYCDYPVGQNVMGIVSSVETHDDPEYSTLYYLKLIKPIPGYDEEEIENSVFPVAEGCVQFWKPAELLKLSKKEIDNALTDIYEQIYALRCRIPGEHKDEGVAHQLSGMMCDIDYTRSELLRS